MELGALVCAPRSPDCQRCPWGEGCFAKRSDRQAVFPLRNSKIFKKQIEREVYIIIDYDNRVLLRKRTERLLHNLWEFPATSFDFPLDNAVSLGAARHTFTHLVWCMTGWLLRVPNAEPPEGCAWVRAEDVGEYAIPSAFAEYMRRVR